MNPIMKLEAAAQRFSQRAGQSNSLALIFQRILADLDAEISMMSVARELIVVVAQNGLRPGRKKRARETPHPSTNGGTQRSAALKVLRASKRKMTGGEVMDAMLKRGVTTASKKFRTVVSPMLVRMEEMGEVRCHRRKGSRSVRWSAR